MDWKSPPICPEYPFCRGVLNEMLTTVPTFDHLYSLFPESPDRSQAVEVSSGDLPTPYHKLLVHTHHMTITVEQFYQSSVDVRVLNSRRSGHEYARKILLSTHDTRRVVQFGLVRINLGVCPELVRKEILEGKTPLGRVLIQHNMLRRIEPGAFLQVTLSPTMANWFGVESGTTTYGRVGVIYTGERPVVEVLEILAPIGAGK
jgi:chorismate-pyruvate lyase